MNDKRAFKQGIYHVRHPEKYMRETKTAVYRSSWEYEVNKVLDNNPNVLKWCSEPFPIPYIKPTDGMLHRYIPDYIIEIRQKDGSIKRMVLEVKPIKDFKQSNSTNRKTRLVENITYAINIAKFQAATKWCHKRGLEFKIVTEQDLFRW